LAVANIAHTETFNFFRKVIARMINDDKIKRELELICRVDSQQQQTVNWLTPADQTALETTIGLRTARNRSYCKSGKEQAGRILQAGYRFRADLIRKHENRNIADVIKANAIKPLKQKVAI
jgi:hypothetical protein